ncbi:hypothetical protein M413DRAFT_242464 [Hebeloma cylindrosporum]|uniref:Protein kinase domain-containing protein n=1 Tax=Hebeloma cylindrosporum TaxID=76867 RepID=A0A0C3C2J5_HEBCY|nr:hypothetical protein M413DRAFT_242464 [Hebeloma cylindrosporum h7]
MSLSWHQRKTRLAALLKSQGDEDADGMALDRLMHGQNVIGKTSKTTEVDGLRFKDKDLETVGTLEYGQFGVIDVVTCRLNNCVYVRKSIEKRFALRTRDQCSPQFERDLLLQAVKTDSPWAPHLLCAFQTPTHLNLVMDYAEGGTLWDVLESSPHDGRIPESDLKWWVPQVVSAIHWCHSQGFAHRDIKPHNFVLTPDAHVLLIDFGSAAPLLPPKPDGSQIIPHRFCLVPCGTCDYISPEILQAHEEALVALELDDEDSVKQSEQEGYGVETDWWSLGAMLYEMAYGVAPFFANDIRQTYIRITNHEKSLRFDQKVEVSHEYQHFLRRLLTNAKQRLGRRNVMEITDHPLFDGVDWTKLISRPAPANLHLPQFTYSVPKPTGEPTVALPPKEEYHDSVSLSQGFAFSAFFQQSSAMSQGLSILRPSPNSGTGGNQLGSSLSTSWKETSGSASSFIGFSWGPALDAFPEDIAYTPVGSTNTAPSAEFESTPRPLVRTPLVGQQQQTPVAAFNTLSVPPTWGRAFAGTVSTPQQPFNMYSTPMKPYALSPYATLPRTSTVRRTAPRRMVSDREAMKQLVDCVGMSARKKVLESGRKPRILSMFDVSSKASTGGRTGHTGGYGTLRKELRFDRFTTPIPGPDYSAANSSRSRGVAGVEQPNQNGNTDNEHKPPGNVVDDSDIYYYSQEYEAKANPARYSPSSDGTSDDSEGGHPPSPSPSPRPGSAMSMMSMTTMLSRRSGTPTISGYFSSGRMRSGSGSLLVPVGDRSATVTTMTASGGLLSIPSAGAGNLEFRIKDMETDLSRTYRREEAKLERGPPSTQALNQKSRRKGSISSVVPSASYSPPQSRPRPGPMEEPKTKGIAQSQSQSRHLRTRTLDEVFPEKLREMERRHTTMMRDIEKLEDKLAEVSGSFCSVR